MSIVTKSIVNADAEARYLSPGELDRIKAFVGGGATRLRIAETLSGARERIIKESGDRLFQKRPDVVSPGGNAYGEEMTATCLRDMDYYLRLITYGVVSGDVPARAHAPPLDQTEVLHCYACEPSVGGTWPTAPAPTFISYSANNAIY